MATEARGSDLERELAAMLQVESFEPPAEFRERALWSHPKVYEEAAPHPGAWWMRQATEVLALRPGPGAAQRRLRRLLRRGRARADGLLPGEGADNRRRRPAQRQDGADQAPGRRADGRSRVPADDRRHPPYGHRLPDAGGARR